MKKKKYGASRDLTRTFKDLIQNELEKKKPVDDSDNLILEKNNQGK